MYLYKSYCYETIQQVVDSIKSQVSYEGIGMIQDVTASGELITIRIKDLKGNGFTDYFYNPPICERLGFDNSYTGIQPNDAQEFGWMLAGILVIAFGFKAIKRTF